MSDAELLDWEALAGSAQWDLLVGNGASRAIWEPFSYESLFDAAVNGDTAAPLEEADQALFDALDTRNFEQVLSQLLSADIVARAVGEDPRPYRRRYESIRLSLAAAVQCVHIPWERTPSEILRSISDGLAGFGHIFSTNYDLLLYWAIMQNPKQFPDYFWNKTNPDASTMQFHTHDVEIHKSGATPVLYLHGGLHLVRTMDGGTHKLRHVEGASILRQFGKPVLDDAVPLVISEGTAENKLASIQQSDYLSFALNKLAERSNPLVVFGHSLSAQDAHLVDAISKRSRTKPLVAVSLRRGCGDEIRRAKDEYRDRLPRADLRFFDAASFPLGDPALKQLT